MDAFIPIPENTARALEFFRQSDWLWIMERVIALLVPLVFLLAGWSAGLRGACERLVGGNWYLTLVLFACVYLTIAAVLKGVGAFYVDVIHRGAWGLPHSVTGFLAEHAIYIVATLAAAVTLLWIPYFLMDRAPHIWWSVTAALVGATAVLVTVVEPIVITPLTAKYEPPAPALAAKFEAMAARCGAPRTVFLVDPKGGDNAFVTGIGPTSRVFIGQKHNDRPEGGMMQGIAHELKHHVMADTAVAIGVATLLALVGLALAQFLGSAVLSAWGARFGVTSLRDPASLPLIIFILTFALDVAGLPIYRAVQRHVELNADIFALEVARENQAQAEEIAKRIRIGTSRADYSWFFRTFRATHPSGRERLVLANTYRPWETGAPLRYADLCRPPER